MNHGGVCRTAPATPGLLIICEHEEEDHNKCKMCARIKIRHIKMQCIKRDTLKYKKGDTCSA